MCSGLLLMFLLGCRLLPPALGTAWNQKVVQRSNQTTKNNNNTPKHSKTITTKAQPKHNRQNIVCSDDTAQSAPYDHDLEQKCGKSQISDLQHTTLLHCPTWLGTLAISFRLVALFVQARSSFGPSRGIFSVLVDSVGQLERQDESTMNTISKNGSVPLCLAGILPSLNMSMDMRPVTNNMQLLTEDSTI